MRKRISLCLLVVLALSVLTACLGTVKAEKNTIYVKKNGKIIGLSVEKFDKAYYDEEELEEYVEEQVENYVADHEEKSVKVSKFSVEEGIAKLNIKYAGYKDYAEFNDVDMFVGTIPQAMAAGYDFDDTFLTVTEEKLGAEVDKKTITSNTEYKVVVLSEKVDVKVDGTIAYVSSKYTSISAKDTVSIVLPEDAQDGEELSLTYIIYK